MGADNTTTTLNGLFKEVYADSLEKLVPEASYLKKNIKFSQEEMVGKKYHQPVLLAQEHGITYAGPDAGAFAINAAIAATLQDASLAGSQMLLKAQMDYESAFRAASGGKKAFVKATELLVENMMESMAKRLELSLLYGTGGLGKVSGNSSGTITITDATWSAATWAGTENCILEAWDGTGATQTQHNGDLTITSVDLDAKTVTVSGTSTNVTTNDWLYFKGARTATTYSEMNGIDSIIINTGTLFGIAANTYNLWKGSTKSSVGQISMSKILDAVSKGVERGLQEKVVVLVSPKAWQVLNSDQAALRKYDSSYSSAKFENGSQGIKFYGPNGEIEIVMHLFCRDGDAFILPLKRLRRIGATDITFNRPGRSDEIFREQTTAAGFELRCYTNQAVFCDMPARTVKMTGITYS